MKLLTIAPGLALLWLSAAALSDAAEPLRAGVARVEITDPQAKRVNDPCFAKALVLQQGETKVALITVDAVAIGEIGPLRKAFLANLRGELAKEPGIPPEHVIVNASHCHGVVRSDSDRLVIQVVREAWQGLTAVKIGVGSAREQRISENRRVTLKDGAQADLRRAYSLPSDEAIASLGPIDPRVGLVRLDRLDGRPLAAIYHFACHPIMNPPSKGSSADFPGFASRVIEAGLGDGAMAFFLQGCGGDINPVRYKEVATPADAEPLGHLLGFTALRALRGIETSVDARLALARRVVALPRAADYRRRIAAIEGEQARLLRSLKGTNLNFKSFLPLYIQQRVSPEFPSAHAQAYWQEQQQGRDDLARHDADQKAQVEVYLANLQTMEQLTRLNTNLALLKLHLAQSEGAATATIDAEICILRIGEFQLITFPGELTVEIGLGLQKAAQRPHLYVSGYTNGYLYYTPTAAQRANPGFAQEDCDTLVAPEWQRLFERTALEMVGP